MRQPVWKDCDVQLENISQLVIFMFVILFEGKGIVDMAGAILGRKIIEYPQRGNVQE